MGISGARFRLETPITKRPSRLYLIFVYVYGFLKKKTRRRSQPAVAFGQNPDSKLMLGHYEAEIRAQQKPGYRAGKKYAATGGQSRFRSAASQFSRMMHVARRQHHVRDRLRSKFFRMQWHPGEWNPADALTKRLGKKLHMKHASVLLGFETINGLDKPLNTIE